MVSIDGYLLQKIVKIITEKKENSNILEYLSTIIASKLTVHLKKNLCSYSSIKQMHRNSIYIYTYIYLTYSMNKCMPKNLLSVSKNICFNLKIINVHLNLINVMEIPSYYQKKISNVINLEKKSRKYT